MVGFAAHSEEGRVIRVVRHFFEESCVGGVDYIAEYLEVLVALFEVLVSQVWRKVDSLDIARNQRYAVVGDAACVVDIGYFAF